MESSKGARDSLLYSIKTRSQRVDIILDYIFSKGRVYSYCNLSICLIVLSIFCTFSLIFWMGVWRYSNQTALYSEIFYKSDILESSSKWI